MAKRVRQSHRRRIFKLNHRHSVCKCNGETSQKNWCFCCPHFQGAKTYRSTKQWTQFSPLVSTSKWFHYGGELHLWYVLFNQVASKSRVNLTFTGKWWTSFCTWRGVLICVSTGSSEISHESPAQPAQQESWTWLQSPWSSWGRLGRTSLQTDVVTLLGRTQIFNVVKWALATMQVGISWSPFYLLELNLL